MAGPLMSSVGFLHIFSVTYFRGLQKVGFGEKLEANVTVVQLHSSLPNSQQPSLWKLLGGCLHSDQALSALMPEG